MDPEALLVFLEMFESRLICAPCLARLADATLMPVGVWLDGKVASGGMIRVNAPCLNCEETATVYRLD